MCVCVHAYAAVPLCMNGYKVFVHVHHHPRTDPLEKINNWTIVATMKFFYWWSVDFLLFFPTKILETRATAKNEKKKAHRLCQHDPMLTCSACACVCTPCAVSVCQLFFFFFFFCLYTPICQLLIFNSCPSSPEKTSIFAQLTCMIERWKM